MRRKFSRTQVKQDNMSKEKTNEKQVEEQVSKTPNRDKFNARMKAKYPEREFADDEELFGQIDSDYETADGNAKTIGALNEMLTDDPRSATFISNWREKGDPLIALIEEYGEDLVQGMLEEGNKEKIAAANQKYLERIAENKKLDDLIAKNQEESQAVVDAKKAEVGDETVTKAMDFIKDIYINCLTGKVTSEMLDMAIQSVNHDQDVAQAQAEGEVKGRNEQIGQKVRKARQGDGVPNIGGGSAAQMPKPKKSMGALDRYGEGAPASIWDRG